MTHDYTISRDSFQARHYKAETDTTIFLTGDLDRKTRISVESGREFTITLADLIAIVRQREIQTAQAVARREAQAAGYPMHMASNRQEDIR